MRTDRLLKLAELLEADAANPEGVKFDLTAWGYSTIAGGDRFDNKFRRDQKVIPVSCDTAACAWGLAAISGIFKEEGVSFEISASERALVPSFNNLYGFDAAKAFFELGEDTDGLEQVSTLFDTPSYMFLKGAPAELEVAKRIRELVANGNLDHIKRH